MEVDHEDDEWHLPSLEELFRSSAVFLNCVPPPPKLAARRQVWTVQFFLHVNMRAGHNGDLFLAENRQRPQGRMASCFYISHTDRFKSGWHGHWHDIHAAGQVGHVMKFDFRGRIEVMERKRKQTLVWPTATRDAWYAAGYAKGGRDYRNREVCVHLKKQFQMCGDDETPCGDPLRFCEAPWID